MLFLFLTLVLVAGVAWWMQQRRGAAATPSDLTPTPSPAPSREGGVYTEALLGRPGRFNPLFDAYNPPDRDVNRLVFCRLFSFDDKGLPQGELVAAWGISADTKIYNIALRNGARWHDGEPVTAEDVAFTIQRMQDDQVPVPETWRTLWKQVQVTILDPYTLQFRLPKPFAPFLDYLTFGLLPKHVWENVPPEEMADHPANLQPVGCGPFRFDHLIVEGGQIQGVALKAFEDYFLGRPYLDEVVFRYYEDAPQALQAYRDGEVLGISEVTPEILDEALKLPGLNFYTARRPRLTLIYLNLGDPELTFFQDVNVRKALLLALDREGMIRRHLQGQGIVASGPVFPDSWAYNPELPQYGYDPDAAVRLLKEAGYLLDPEGRVRKKEDTALRFELAFPENEPYPALAQDIQKAWQRIGVEVTLKAVPFEELLKNYLEPRNYQAVLIDLVFTRTPDPDPYPFWHESQTPEGQNYAGWKNRRASLFLERARVTPDWGKRKTYYQLFQKIFAEELPALPLFYPVYTYAVDRQIQGVRFGPIYDRSDRFLSILSWYVAP